MNISINVIEKMKELWFRKASKGTALGKGVPIAYRCKAWNSDKFYLTGEPAVWYKPPLDKADDKADDKVNLNAWWAITKVDLSNKNLQIDGMSDYMQFYIDIQSQHVNPLGASDWSVHTFTVPKTYPKIDPSLRKKSGGGKAKGRKANKEEDMIGPDPDSGEDDNLPESRSDAEATAREDAAALDTDADEDAEGVSVTSSKGTDGVPPYPRRTAQAPAKIPTKIPHPEAKKQEAKELFPVPKEHNIQPAPPRATTQRPTGAVRQPTKVPQVKKEDRIRAANLALAKENAKERKPQTEEEKAEEQFVKDHGHFGRMDIHVDDLENKLGCYICSSKEGHRQVCDV
jgi:hypothetical protein